MKRKLITLIGFLILGLLVGARHIYRSRKKTREPSLESMDDPAVAEAFNRVANWPQMRLLRWYVARRILRLNRKGQAADIGCGPGHLVFKLAQEASDIELIGIDLSDEVLAKAESYAAQLGFTQSVRFKKGSAQEIPFPDDSLDLVFSTLSLHHWSDPVAVLNEISRVLRPGGNFLIFDLRRDMAPPFYMLLWFASRFIVPRSLRNVNEPLGSRDAAYTIQEAAQLVEDSILTHWKVDPGPLWLVIESVRST